jgi:hypothetical protein
MMPLYGTHDASLWNGNVEGTFNASVASEFPTLVALGRPMLAKSARTLTGYSLGSSKFDVFLCVDADGDAGWASSTGITYPQMIKGDPMEQVARMSSVNAYLTGNIVSDDEKGYHWNNFHGGKMRPTTETNLVKSDTIDPNLYQITNMAIISVDDIKLGEIYQGLLTS